MPDCSLSLLKSKLPAHADLFYPKTNLHVNYAKMAKREEKRKQRIKDGKSKQKFEENVTKLTVDLFKTTSNNLDISIVNSQ